MDFCCFRPEIQHRGPSTHSENDLPEQEEEILGSDDDEQEDPNDYCKGMSEASFWTETNRL